MANMGAHYLGVNNAIARRAVLKRANGDSVEKNACAHLQYKISNNSFVLIITYFTRNLMYCSQFEFSRKNPQTFKEIYFLAFVTI